MKKISVLVIASVSVLLSGCLSEGVVKQLSEDCAKVGGRAVIEAGMMGSRARCEPQK